jgi:hypothetical protein
MIREAKIALFNPTNYTADDYLGDHRTQPIIAVKRLVNADSMPIPPGPNGEIFTPRATPTTWARLVRDRRPRGRQGDRPRALRLGRLRDRHRPRPGGRDPGR